MTKLVHYEKGKKRRKRIRRNRGRRRNGETEDGIKGKKGENVEEKMNGVYKK